MKHFAGLDASVKETFIYIVGATGKSSRAMKVISHPDDLAEVLTDSIWNFVRVGQEAGPYRNGCTSLAEAGLPMICVETRHAKRS
jgi:hypothetical protein